MRHLDLFSGIGGFAIAAQWVWGEEHEIVSFCEIDKFCQKVLKKNFGDVPCCEDIKELTNEWIIANCEKLRLQEQRPEGQEQVEFDGNNKPQIDLLTGGFPCQPYSVAGKRLGNDDDRAIWPEMLRVIRETKPRWVIGENVAGFVNMALDEVCTSLEMENYEVQPIIIPACAVNAPHRRDRVWIVANNNKWQSRPRNVSKPVEQKQFKSCADNSDTNALYSVCMGLQGQPWRRPGQEPEDGYLGTEPENDTNTECNGLQRLWLECNNAGQDRLQSGKNREWDKDWLEVATNLCGAFNGLSNWIYRNNGVKEYAKTIEKITGQDMPNLWQGIQSESLQWSSGRFNTIQNKDDVFAILWKFFSESFRQDDLSFQSKEAQDAYLRNVWESNKIGRTPQRWEYQEQYTREHTDHLSQLSHEVALASKELSDGYKKNRLDRLKSLGNAIVPQIAQVIMQAIKEIEKCSTC